MHSATLGARAGLLVVASTPLARRFQLLACWNSCKLSADDAGVWGARTETEILDTSQDAGEIVDAGDAGEGMLGMLEMSRMLVMLGVGDADNDGVAGDAGTTRQPSIFDAFWTHTPKSAQFHAPSPSSQFVGQPPVERQLGHLEATSPANSPNSPIPPGLERCESLGLYGRLGAAGPLGPRARVPSAGFDC